MIKKQTILLLSLLLNTLSANETSVINFITHLLTDKTEPDCIQPRLYFESTLPANATLQDVKDAVASAPFVRNVTTDIPTFTALAHKPEITYDDQGNISILADVTREEFQQQLYDDFEKFRKENR